MFGRILTYLVQSLTWPLCLHQRLPAAVTAVNCSLRWGPKSPETDLWPESRRGSGQPKVSISPYASYTLKGPSLDLSHAKRRAAVARQGRHSTSLFHGTILCLSKSVRCLKLPQAMPNHRALRSNSYTHYRCPMTGPKAQVAISL